MIYLNLLMMLGRTRGYKLWTEILFDPDSTCEAYGMYQACMAFLRQECDGRNCFGKRRQLLLDDRTPRVRVLAKERSEYSTSRSWDLSAI